MSLNKSKALRTAEKYVLQGKIPAAIDEYRKVVDADPTDLTTINTLGDLYVRAGRIQDAISNFSRIADSYREGGFTLKAIAMLKKISKLDPTNIDTSMKLANLYSQQGLLVEARQQYLQVADAYARAGQTRKALEAYQKIADLDPANTSVRMKLGEIYAREQMSEQAHEAFILAGTEFLRKGDTEQALNANLKAFNVNPESRLALTAIATIYTQQGQIDRAINILCDAFERNPGDVELLTILGRTYLSAGMMDDAERTFLSLVELDRNRFHYLLEVGRKFLQMGNLDRATEQIDGCLEALIAKREEDKAIEFLRRILDRDLNHLGALKRLAQIFLRIREDHNLIATLNSLVEAAMRKGDDQEAIAALRELVRMEPNEPMHLQRLYNLGVRDIVESDAPDVVRATGPLDYQAAAFDDAFVVRQVSEAEILAGHGQVEQAIDILKGILNYAPEHIQVHLKLKDIYLRAGMMDQAALECVELARLHEARGESARASDYHAEAQQHSPFLSSGQPKPEMDQGNMWPGQMAEPFDFAVSHSGSNGDAGAGGGGAFDFRESSGELDWGRYQTGVLADHAGFVTAPERDASDNNGARANHSSSLHGLPSGTAGFRYSDTLVSENGNGHAAETDAAEMVFDSAGVLPTDTMPRILRDELEGIDFYIAQGYIEIARDTLDRLREDHGDHPEILARYSRLGEGQSFIDATIQEERDFYSQENSYDSAVGTDANFNGSLSDQSTNDYALIEEPAYADFTTTYETASGEVELSVAPELAEAKTPEVEAIEAEDETPLEGNEQKEGFPFLINKESGPLYQDLIVQFNTSDLLNDTLFDQVRRATGQLPAMTERPIGTGDLIESLVSSIDTSFSEIQQTGVEQREIDQPFSETEMPACEEASSIAANSYPEAAGQYLEVLPQRDVEAAQITRQSEAADTFTWTEPVDATRSEDDLADIFEELKEKTGELKPPVDFETHYSLGLAYKDMDLLDEAIEEFQMAFRAAGFEDQKGDYIHCCNMLGLCFKRKQMPKIAIMWFQRGLRIPDRSEDEYQALRYDIGICYEEMGEHERALDVYMDVYGMDVSYREVGEKIKQLQALKNA